MPSKSNKDHTDTWTDKNTLGNNNKTVIRETFRLHFGYLGYHFGGPGIQGGHPTSPNSHLEVQVCIFIEFQIIWGISWDPLWASFCDLYVIRGAFPNQHVFPGQLFVVSRDFSYIYIYIHTSIYVYIIKITTLLTCKQLKADTRVANC